MTVLTGECTGEEDGKLLFLVPENQLHPGNYQVKIELEPFKETDNAMKDDDHNMMKTTTWDSFKGSLKDSSNFNEHPLDVQRKMRDEWD